MGTVNIPCVHRATPEDFGIVALSILSMSMKDGNVQMPMGTGFWTNTKPPQYSKETQDLLKVMMQESKLTNFQQRQIREHLQSGAALPIQCHPSSSHSQSKPLVSAPQSEKASIVNKRPSLRPAERCRAGDAYMREKFQPQATRDLNKEKSRLQNLMATGKELSDVPQLPPPQIEEKETDRFDELIVEIQERRDFLEEMEALGRGKQYYNIINTEISQKLREMEIIDKQRSAELQEELQKSKNKMPGPTPSPNTCS
ncbi:hypothetical protein GDO78_009658 [Eleutherodactylus coqui]|uniref:Uncharacterized protein n=2 Tax=Eleutherodactylus coqui TaxID=57060 RepID=A0A8J6FAP8_ELECQ|nr:hypothetical protein GDO78_009658 [Eleutherodactylus coqui]